jgi:hypothetical protein
MIGLSCDLVASEEAESYLAAHPQLAELIPAIAAEVRREFGTEAELSLELYKDPEVHDSYVTLYVRKKCYEPDMLNRLESVSKRFQTRLEEVSGYLLIATDFARPRGHHGV